jgi:hypothetical protein
MANRVLSRESRYGYREREFRSTLKTSRAVAQKDFPEELAWRVRLASFGLPS